MEDDSTVPLRVLELQQNIVTEYATEMKKKCDGSHALSDDEFEALHIRCFSEALNAFSDDQSTDNIGIQVLKQQLYLKHHELKKQNDEKPSVASTAGGAVAGAAAGVGVAAGGAVGTAAVTSAFAVSATVATGGLVLVGIAAVGVGVGIGFGVKKLINHIQEKERLKRGNSKSKMY